MLRCIIPIYNPDSQLQSSHLVYSPLSLFLTQQNVISKASRSNFARDTRKEFYAIFTTTMISSHQHHHSASPSRWNPFKRRSLLSDATPPPWHLGKYLEDGPLKVQLGHETLVEAGQGLPLAAVESSHESRRALSVFGVMLQKSVSVTVRDKDPVDTIQPLFRSTSSMSTSESEHEPVASKTSFDDEATWADICFRGILK